MKSFEFNLEKDSETTSPFPSILINQFFRRKYLSPLGLLLFIAIAAMVSYSVFKNEALSVALIIAISVAVPLIIFSVTYVHFGIYVLLIISFFILGLLRFTDQPLGLLMDSYVILLLAAVVYRMILSRDWAVFSNPSGLIVMVWIFYNLVEVINPDATSKLAWVYSIRGVAVILLFYYVAAYAIRTPEQLYIFINILVFLCFLLGAYGLFQEFYGLLPFEEAWIRADEQRFALFYNWGKFRKCSFFSSPTIFGITAAAGGVMCLALSLGVGSIWRKLYLLGTSLMLFLSMVFSGTRTAYAILPAAIVFFAIITMKKNTLIFTAFFLAVGAGIILSPINSLGPIDANNLERIRSAFLFEEDPSFNVRLKNQAFIQPYIQNHPFGAGLGSCGEMAKKYSPESPFANFPPDSGFVKIAVESGYIGLAIYCLMIFIVVRAGLLTYFKTENKKLKNYLIACLTLIYSIIIANYAQETITFYPINIIMYVVMAAIVNLKEEKRNINKPYLNETSI